MAGAERPVTGHDISLELTNLVLARTHDERGVVVASVNPAQGIIGPDDVLVLRAPDGRRYAARWMRGAPGHLASAADYVVIGVYRATPGGQRLATLLDEVGGSLTGGHDWGALGLPEGPDTLVASTRDAAQPSDLDEARFSWGHAAWADDWHISLAPGDTVCHQDRRAVIVAIDRRRQAIELEGERGAITVGFEDISPTGATL